MIFVDTSQVRVLLVPFPITPLVAYAYFIFRRFGSLPSDVKVRYLDAASTESVSYYLGKGRVLRLGRKELDKDLNVSVWERTGEDKFLLRRMLEYCRSGRERGLKSHLLRSSALFSPKDSLDSAFRFFSESLLRKRDLWKDGWNTKRDGSIFQIKKVPRIRPVLGVALGTFPILKNNKPGEKVVVKTASFQLMEWRARLLEGESFICAVVGPKASGKSTFADSLNSRINQILESLKSRGGAWKKFSFCSRLENLDLGAPTDVAIGFDVIGSELAKDREVTADLKRPWTTDLALEALEAASLAKESPGLVIADTPGKISGYTEIVASLADVAVIVTNNWRDEMPKWIELSNRLGLRLVVQVRSRQQEEGFSSLITGYAPRNFVTGRVVGLDRVDHSYDTCISQTAAFLIFDILPSVVERRRKKIKRLLSEA